MQQELIIVLDFGGQYNQLIARRVRECSVYAEVHPYTMTVEEIRAKNPKGIIFTGGPNSVNDPESPHCSPELFELGIPILGICYGAQLMAQTLGGRVEKAEASEYGRTKIRVAGAEFPSGSIKSDVDEKKNVSGREACDAVKTQPAQKSRLFWDVHNETTVWMSHTDQIAQTPEGFAITASSDTCPVAAMEDESRRLYAFQFHPEVLHTTGGDKMISQFVLGVCGCSGSWKMDSYVEEQIAALREKIGDGRVLCALSGGVDSSVAAVLLSKAVGKQLTCVFVDHGLLRKDEGDQVEAIFGPEGPYELNFIRVNAQKRFYGRLRGITEPEEKRKRIGEEFIRVFEEEAKKIGAVDFLGQGTIYPDVIESGLGKAATIKSHHNVGGLPEHISFREIIEPLRMLFKDEVRQAGRELGLPEYLISRQPFPGPGLGVRIVGEVTAEKVRMVQEADAIFREEVAEAGCAEGLGQYFAALTNMRSVGVMGDERTYDYAVALRAVLTSDFMTAEAAQLPYDVLNRCMTRIINEVKGVNRVLYDITSKPPGTIELE